MKKIIIFLFVLVEVSFSGILVQANDAIVGGLSNNNIAINTNFDGSDILIFGSIKRANNKRLIPSDIIIEIIGPRIPIIVRKKRKKFFIWINSDPIKIDESPSFYALLSSQDPLLILSESEAERYSIGKKKISSVKNHPDKYLEAVDATYRIRKNTGSYKFETEAVSLKNDTLFSANVTLPSNLTEGDYETIIYLIQDKKVVSFSTDVITVRKIGLERFLYKTAHEQPLFYGFFSIFLALISGWGASALFRRFQQ